MIWLGIVAVVALSGWCFNLWRNGCLAKENETLRQQLKHEVQVTIGNPPHQLIAVNPMILGEIWEKYGSKFMTQRREDVK